MRSTLALLIFVLSLASTLPASAYDVHVEGVLVGFDQKRIQLRQENGRDIYIPRSSFGSLDGYVTGKANLKVAVKVKELLAANKTGKTKL